MVRIICSVLLTEEENWIVATDAKTGITSQGETSSIAIANLKEDLELYYKDIPNEIMIIPMYSDMKKWGCKQYFTAV